MSAVAVTASLRTRCGPAIAAAAAALIAAFDAGGHLWIFGNGGSAADAQHIAAELAGRFRRERRALPATALTTNSSSLTAIANDYGYDAVFARQLDGVCRPGDVVLGISTSGSSRNVVAALALGRRLGARTIALTGEEARDCAPLVDILIDVPAATTPRVQECHILVGHILCEIVERSLFPPE
jgi:D-sedoheptulose 7-phosphate isomerase